jgi:hypothetical protein
VNPVVQFLLHTPVMGSARKQMMVLSFSGRTSGRRYTVPVSAHHIDGVLYALTGARWRLNFRDGANSEVFYDGTTTMMRGELVEEPTTVADLYYRCARTYGPRRAQRSFGMKFSTEGLPSPDQFAEVVARDHLGAVKLLPLQ